ncbi:LacI family DNA-binding transcriptional regulator [Tessaracoccus sp. MC1756]|uniref:LacI family DNA-binding transcriptional regulator n=1 Tax=Tessaracoccus sp. MC1756 TaxID=2760311 RepID=UPI001600CF88|nr:LacI family DNA-binding transcriptional regulator [Tessaracoccus sp. MC1756]MBB1509321.1 LacI family DNA-binding transcriptional regulator [Tessaracoccus sp. MC1756]
MREVAAAAGVSTATVSRVANGGAGVDPDLAKRVQGVIDEMGYRPNLVARGLRSQSTPLLALVIPDIENAFFTSLCRGVEDVARRQKFSVMLCNTDEDPAKEAAYLGVLAAHSVSGVIISAASVSSDLAPVTSRGIAVVGIGRRLGDGFDCVRTDSEAGARQATRHLLSYGAERVACITGADDVITAEERLQGYKHALEAAGLAVDDDLIVHANFREDGAYRAMNQLLDLDQPPDGVFVANNRMTIGAMRACRERGVSIPEELSLVGFDDLPWADLTTPSITTMRQPTYEIGAAAARLLLERIGGEPGAGREIVFQPELAVRQSSVKKSAASRP